MNMSKSLAVDALLTAVDGGHVAVFGDSEASMRAAARWFRSEYPELDVVAEMIHAKHRESMTFPGGGTLTFLSLTSNPDRLRGWCLDRCYVPIGTSPRFVEDHLRWNLHASKDGTMAGY
ncbi:hypothetical protein SAMN04487917_101353 [Arthrobacter sp. yr096]|uniref:hypothetical protein n=1 Tax=Arthrobacter sp. yr096 TaxID=1761750 RepID=UPI0008D84380|nr:hypothetical protein [Arthrobacter sp. yr096]SEI44954.1 hypothetical protein SAMN04487917_101353 [Arthrobacter sp. yr096]